MAYPQEFAFLQPFALRCDMAGNDDDCARLLDDFDPQARQEFAQLYARLVRDGFKPRLDAWFAEQDGIAPETSEVSRLLVLLDYMARHGMIAAPEGETRFIEWDDREFDDHGNEW